MTPEAPARPAPPAPIEAVPVRHPWRWVAVGIIAVLAAMFVHMLLTNDAFQWEFIAEIIFSRPVLEGARTSLIMTVLAMICGVAIGIVVAVMRLSDNPVLSSLAWLYTWFFRAIPRVALLLLAANLGILYQRYSFGVPFDAQIGNLLGIDFDGELFGLTSRDLISGFVAGLIGLALTEGAYMAEIVRAGIQSVDPGQAEAAQALGMRRSLALRRIVLPQAMRVIVPPTGNETIAMLKDTSLLLVVPVTNELLFQLRAIGTRTFQVIPTYVAAILWYLALTSLLMVGQYFIEKRFSRGFGQPSGRQQAAADRIASIEAQH